MTSLAVNNIAILGSGTCGIATGRMLAKHGLSIKMWTHSSGKAADLNGTHVFKGFEDALTLPESITFTSDIDDALAGADAVVFATDSRHTREVAKLCSGKVDFGPKLIVSSSKGMEPGTCMTMSEIVCSELWGGSCAYNPVVVLSGPTHAEEVVRDMPTVAVAACDDMHLAEAAQGLFSNECFRVYTSGDREGVEFCGTVKNVIAIASGLSAGLGYGDNSRAALITRGITEMKRLGSALGYELDTFDGLAGVGDLVVTASSEHSRNCRFGELLAKGMCAGEACAEIGMAVEGLYSIEAVLELAGKVSVELPIVEAVNKVLTGEWSPSGAVAGLMERELKSEAEFPRPRTVLTYGTFDLLHYGHINLLRRASALGDRLIVAISTDEFNWNEKQKKCYFTYEQRKAMVEAISYVDLVIPEENWGQKRTDVHKYHVDTFVMGDDWKGKFDFLEEEGVEVVYLPRTPEISTTQIKRDLEGLA